MVREHVLEVTAMAAEIGDARNDGYVDKLDERGRWGGSELHRGGDAGVVRGRRRSETAGGCADRSGARLREEEEAGEEDNDVVEAT